MSKISISKRIQNLALTLVAVGSILSFGWQTVQWSHRAMTKLEKIDAIEVRIGRIEENLNIRQSETRPHKESETSALARGR